MLILSIDSANFSLSTALVQEEQTLAYAENKEAHTAGALLIPMIQGLFKEASLSLQDVSHIAVTLGPGSFTGTRVGLAAARGFALSLNIPVLGVNTFEWVAQSYKKLHALSCPLLVALDSKREEHFVTLFSQDLEQLEKPTYLRPDQLNDYVKATNPMFTGNAAAFFSTASSSWMPNAQHLALYAREKLKRGLSFEEAKPFYLRPPEINEGKLYQIPD